MDPLNKQERTEAIIKMLVYYFIAVIVIAVPMYFIFSLPEKETKWNKEQYEEMFQRLKGNAEAEKEFLVKTDSAIALFNAYQNEKDEMARDKIQLRYSNSTNQMEDFLQVISDDSTRVDLYDNIIYAYNNLFMAWKEKYQLQEELDECMNRTQDQKQEIKEKSELVKIEKTKTIQEKEIDLIIKALEKHNGNKRSAAEELGTTERKLKKRMKELGMDG